MKQKILLALTSFLLLLVLSTDSKKALAATILLQPDTQSIGAGTTFTLSIDEDSSTDPVNAVQFSLRYPASSFSHVSISTMNSSFPIQAENTQGTGSITIARGAITPVKGKQHIVTVSFTTSTPVSLQSIAVDPTALIVRSSDHKNIFTPSSSTSTSAVQHAYTSGMNGQQQQTTTQPQNHYQNSYSPQTTHASSSLPLPKLTIVQTHPSSPTLFSIIADFFKHLFGRK